MRERGIGAVAIVAVGLGFVLGACGIATPQASDESSVPSHSPIASPASGLAFPSSTPQPTVARWETTGSMTRERWSFHVHALPDGRVLVIDNEQTAELWDPVNGEWRPTAGLNNPRTKFASVALADGRVLVAGGLNDIGQSYSSAYIFDPATESWAKTPGLMLTARTSPSAALLPDGRVLVTGGYFHVEPNYGQVPGTNVLAAYGQGTDQPGSRQRGSADIVPGPFGAALATSEIFDPATGQWESTGPMRYARNGPAITSLADGRVLVVGTLPSDETGVEVPAGAPNSSEIFDPQAGTFILAGELPELDLSGPEDAGVNVGYHTTHTGHLLPLHDGGAILIHHETAFKHVGFATRSLRFDPTNETWREIVDPYISVEDPSSGANYSSAGSSRSGPTIARLADGRVMVAGGEFQGSDLSSAEVYDPTADTWAPLPDMPEPRSRGQAAVLPDRSVLVIGGVSLESGARTFLTSAVRLVVDSSTGQ